MSEDQLEASQGGKRVIHELGETLFRVRPLRWTLEKRSRAPPGRDTAAEKRRANKAVCLTGLTGGVWPTTVRGLTP